MDKELKAARLQMAEINSRIQRLKRDLAVTQEAISRAEAEYYRLDGTVAALERERPKRSDASIKKGTKARLDNPKRGDVAEAALALIRQAGKPLSRAELYDHLTKDGLRIEGGNPVMVFSTMLWREKSRIVRLRGFGYWFADQPYPPAGYVPPGQTAML